MTIKKIKLHRTDYKMYFRAGGPDWPHFLSFEVNLLIRIRGYFLSSVRLGALPQGLFSHQIHLLYCTNREPLFSCLKYTKYVLSKLGASKCAPAGAFFPTKNTPSIFHQ